MKKFVILLIVASFACIACTRKPMHVAHVHMQTLPVDSSLDAIQDSTYLATLAPITSQLEEQLNIPLGNAPQNLSSAGVESPLLNWAADALYEMAVQITEQHVDVAVVNRGGLRCEWAAGDITFRHVFELMPFDNELVLLHLSGEDMYLLAQNCIDQHGQGVSRQMRVIGEDGQLADVTLSGQPINPEATYTVATSDYLSGGADGLSALTHFSERIMTGKKIRDLYIDYVQQVKIVESAIDGRMQIL